MTNDMGVILCGSDDSENDNQPKVSKHHKINFIEPIVTKNVFNVLKNEKIASTSKLSNWKSYK